jgi:alcohol dehydrogenase
MTGFDYQPRTRLIYGNHSIQRIADVARDVGARRILLVTDPGLVAAGHPDRVQGLLRAAGFDVVVFDRVKENPTTRCVENCLVLAREGQVDTMIGLGGGSSMDTAKGCNFLLTNGGCIQDYRGMGKATRPLLPLIAVPTTAGTGSECQCAALISDEHTHEKMACLDPKAAARVALLDPILTLSQPAAVTAHTGIDALAHAVETAVTTKRNPLSLMFSHEAFKRIVPGLPKVLEEPGHVEARGQMLLAAAYAGTAIENSMLGAAHAAANPLTAHYNIVHGEAVGLMLPLVVRYNAEDPEAQLGYAHLASAPEIACVSDGPRSAVDALIARIEHLLNQAGIARSLADLNVDPDLIPVLSKEAAGQWTATFNPRPIGPTEMARLYERAFKRRGDGDAGRSTYCVTP